MELVFGPGVKLDNERAQALRSPLRVLPTPEELILPVCPAGQKKEWKIANIGDMISPDRAAALCESRERAVCPPVGGQVTAVENRTMPGGENWLCLIYTAKDVPGETRRAIRKKSPKGAGREEILKAAAATSLMDELDGADLCDKLRQFAQNGIDILVCDGICDDPYNTDSLRALLENTEEVLGGLKMASRAADCAKIMVVTSRASDATRREAVNLKKRVTVPYMDVSGKYPVWVNLAQREPFKDQKIGRIGVQACLRLFRTVNMHRPAERCIITVGGTALRENINFSVTIGTPISKVLERCEVRQDGYCLVAVGSAIKGECVVDPETTPITQSTRCVLAFSELPPVPRSCIGCGRCSEVCPAGVFPLYVMNAMERGDKERAEYFGLHRCIDCRACEIVCPSNIPLSARILRASTKEPQPMELWRNRGEAHQDAKHE